MNPHVFGTGFLPGPLLVVLAVFGCLAILYHLSRALLRLGLTAAESAALSGLADVSARRGDITGLAERRELERRLRRARRVRSAVVAGWLLLLVVPPAAGWAAEAYAAAVLLWFLPRRPLRPRRESPHTPPAEA